MALPGASALPPLGRVTALPGASALPPPGTVTAGPQQPVVIVCISDDNSDGAGPSEVKPRSQRLPTTVAAAAARRPTTCCPIVICIDDSDDDEAAVVGPAPSARGEAGSSGPRGPLPTGEVGAAAAAAASGVAPLASDGPEWLTDARAALLTLLQGVLAQLQKFDVVGREVSGVLWMDSTGGGG